MHNVQLLSPSHPWITTILARRNSEKLTIAQKRGLLYEKRTHLHLGLSYGPEYIPGPWISFIDRAGKARIIQPDGIIIRLGEGTITCVEIKISHRRDAFDKLEGTYLPAVRALFTEGFSGRDGGLSGGRVKSPSPWHFQACEITTAVDPSVALSRPMALVREPHLCREGFSNVCVMRVRGLMAA